MENKTTNKSVEMLELVLKIFNDACSINDIPEPDELFRMLTDYDLEPTWRVCDKTLAYWITHPYSAAQTAKRLKAIDAATNVTVADDTAAVDDISDDTSSYAYDKIFGKLATAAPAASTASTSKIDRLRNLADTIISTYAAKNHDYGDSFGQSVNAYGLIAALTRISDKFHRLEGLVLGQKPRVNDEGLRDTLLDLATYAMMTVLELGDNNN